MQKEGIGDCWPAEQLAEVFLLFWFPEWHTSLCCLHVVMSAVCFPVRSADSGIQNSADGSKEMLANTPSNNSLADAGETARLLLESVGQSVKVENTSQP